MPQYATIISFHQHKGYGFARVRRPDETGKTSVMFHVSGYRRAKKGDNGPCYIRDTDPTTKHILKSTIRKKLVPGTAIVFEREANLTMLRRAAMWTTADEWTLTTAEVAKLAGKTA